MARLLAVFVLAIFATLSCADGYAFYRTNIPNGFNVQHPCDPSKTWQGVGHHSDQGGNARNQFGLDFKAAGYRWTGALCRNDSDGDGVSNGQELGDPNCTWLPGQSASRTVNITHPGFKTPIDAHPYVSGDTTTLDCSAFFKKCKAFSAPGVKYIDLRAPNNSKNSQVPAKETTYFNMNFELPADRQYHAVGFAPILDNLNVIHHFVMVGCDRPIPVGEGYEDFNFMEGCERTMYAWSFGMQDECLPVEAGVPFGGKHPRYVQVQLHWTNKNKHAGYQDTSGVRVYYTSKLRQYDMGTLTLGQLQLTIPPKKDAVDAPFTCTTDCTQTFFDQGPVKMTASFPHMHFLGKSLFVDVIKPTGQRTRIMDDKVYNYNSPVTYEYPSPQYMDIEAGDRFEGKCVFSSQDRNETTRWGFGSFEEMCFVFIRYYPSRGELSCSQYDSHDFCYQTSTVEGPRCSVFGYFENITITVNKALKECSDVIDIVEQEKTGLASSPAPTTAPNTNRPVCTSSCLKQVDRVLKAHRSPCQQTRHKKEWKLLNSLIETKMTSLDAVVTHCNTVGVVDEEQQNGNSGGGMIAVSSMVMLVVMVCASILL
ncbi:DBH-like monooxygenase protein 2 [Sycon ciliatum]|uniref:DBH-like monooxygenase protein 2 n=1 Tax=Sycon ciliatum TaxID=27933 RepID=UPI0031F69B78